jgi:peptidoglycan-N-acetylglucosamine deacetylase
MPSKFRSLLITSITALLACLLFLIYPHIVTSHDVVSKALARKQSAAQSSSALAASAAAASSKQNSDSVIYLTFDDGPNATTTPQLLQTLKTKQVKATFFVTGNGPDSLIKQEYDEGNRIGLHTYTHNYAEVYSSIDNYFNDLERINERVIAITGYHSKLVRVPGGSANTISNSYSPNIMSYILPEIRNRGYQYFDWNVSAGDGSVQTNSDQPYNSVISELQPHRDNVVLMHDTKQTSVDAVGRIIDYANQNGYRFALLDTNSYPAQQR